MASLPSKTPTQALGVNSFFADSPPFLGVADSLQQEPTIFELDSLTLAGINAAAHTDSIKTLNNAKSSDTMREELQLPNPMQPDPTVLDSEKYHFPRHKLKTKLNDESKTPLVIVACGSFSPPTYLHLRMFEMAQDCITEKGACEIIGGYYSPVSDAYKKPGLASAQHRVRMCALSVQGTSNWLMVDPWEARQSEYTPTAPVMDHFDEEINSEGGILLSNGTRRRVKIMLLAGGDLIQSFGEPGVWLADDLRTILGKYGCLIVERTGSDVWAFLLSHDLLYEYRRNVIVIKQLIYNDISSTKVRLFVKRSMSVKYLLPNSVINYVYDNQLYGHKPLKPAP